jgi:hypothetical protein
MSDNNKSFIPVPAKVSVIYDGTAIIGWCQTWQEADFICEKMPKLQWEMKKITNSIQNTPQVISSIICCDK